MITNKVIDYKVELLPATKGLACHPFYSIYINLDCIEWKWLDYLTNNTLLEEISRVIVHENMHLLIGDEKSKHNLFIDKDKEEFVCKIMAGQQL